MNEYKTLAVEKLDKEEYEAAMKAVNEVRQKRANEIAKAEAIRMIVDAVDKALTMAHPADMIDILHKMLYDVIDAAEDEERAMRDE